MPLADTQPRPPRNRPQMARGAGRMQRSASFVTTLGLVFHVADTVPRYDVRSTCRAAVTSASKYELKHRRSSRTV